MRRGSGAGQCGRHATEDLSHSERRHGKDDHGRRQQQVAETAACAHPLPRGRHFRRGLAERSHGLQGHQARARCPGRQHTERTRRHLRTALRRRQRPHGARMARLAAEGKAGTRDALHRRRPEGLPELDHRAQEFQIAGHSTMKRQTLRAPMGFAQVRRDASRTK